MRLILHDTARMVHAIERTSPRQFIVHTQPGQAVGNMVTVSGEVLGDALRARFDHLEQWVDNGQIDLTMVKSEMDEIARHLMEHNI